MKIIGYPKSEQQLNTFVKIIFEKNGVHFVQIQNLFTSVVSYHQLSELVSNIYPLKFEGTIHSEEETLFFLKEDSSYYIGTLNEIKPKLIEELENVNLIPTAKIEIARKLKLTGLMMNYIQESENLFNELGIKAKFNFDFIDNFHFLNTYQMAKLVLLDLLIYIEKTLSLFRILDWKNAYYFRKNFEFVIIDGYEISSSLLYTILRENGYLDFANNLIQFTHIIVAHNVESRSSYQNQEKEIDKDLMNTFVAEIKNKFHDQYS